MLWVRRRILYALVDIDLRKARRALLSFFTFADLALFCSPSGPCFFFASARGKKKQKQSFFFCPFLACSLKSKGKGKKKQKKRQGQGKGRKIKSFMRYCDDLE